MSSGVEQVERIKPAEILASAASRFAAFRELGEWEQQVITDAKSGWNEPQAERLRSEIRDVAGRSAKPFRFAPSQSRDGGI